ncbi:PhnD/SsuA/transferrin family substrate-binding protein [uncultured Cocleimonas sp.]|uniref:PhnD/SsuA/transferrin family substrate-binding protein n=1 Tax=uncultured Cocleimonas sp. TaxID=1051587 RepID=UPI00262CFA79|nr:PhnD/SsuA/transferrin family substrate-binding protein [uncultured Cocleimonas sp.]
MMKKLLLISILFAQLSATVFANTLKLDFGVYGSERRNWVDDQNEPILRHLEKSLKAQLNKNVEINIVFFPAYKDALDALVDKKIDFARLGGASYVAVKRRSPNVSILASESSKGRPYYEGVIGVLKDSPIKKVEDLKGRSFAFGNKSSTIGRYLSQKFLVDNGITAGDLAGYNYLGRHDNVAIAVIRDVYDAGAFKIDILKNKNFSKRIRTIASFRAPTQSWVARDGLDPLYTSSLKKGLLNTPKEAFIIKNRDGFIEGDDSNFESLRNSIEHNSLFFMHKRTENTEQTSSYSDC